ncbi:MCE family protein, partial [bacterium]|nr:MCE family protein [bacterium]
MMQISPTARVGMLAVVAMVLIGIVFTQIGHMGTSKGTPYVVVFSDVMGLQMRAPVQFSGVRVGYVSNLTLNDQNLVEVTMFITRPDVQLYSSDYCTYTITSDILGSKWLDIKPGPVPEGAKPVTELDRLKGVSPVSFDTLARQGTEVLEDLKASIRALNSIIDDDAFRSDIKQSITNFRDITGNLRNASASAKDLVQDLQSRVDSLADALEGVVGHVDQTVVTFQSDARQMGQDLREVTGTVKGLVANNAQSVNDLVSNLHAISVSLRHTAEVVEQLAEDKDIQADVKGVADNLRKVSEEVAGILQDVRSITNDPNVQQDIKGTLQNVRETTESANRTVKKVEGVVDRFTGNDKNEEGKKKKKFIQADISNDWNLNNGKASTNINATLFPDGPWNVKFGLD